MATARCESPSFCIFFYLFRVPFLCVWTKVKAHFVQQRRLLRFVLCQLRVISPFPLTEVEHQTENHSFISYTVSQGEKSLHFLGNNWAML